jgi:hypothetical protein
MPAPILQRLGHTCSHMPQLLHFLASSTASASVTHSFLLLGADFHGYLNRYLGCLLENRGWRNVRRCPLPFVLLSSSVSISVASSSPYIALSRQATTAVPTLVASCGVSVLIHCSSVIITSAMPDSHEEKLARQWPNNLSFVRVSGRLQRSTANTRRPLPYLPGCVPVGSQSPTVEVAGLCPDTRMVGLLLSIAPHPISTSGVSATEVG